MNMTFLMAFLRCRSAAAANHLSGWLGLAVSGAAAWLVSGGYVEQVREFVCQASNDDIGLAILAIGGIASFLNTGTTAVLTPKPEAQKQEAAQYPDQRGMP